MLSPSASRIPEGVIELTWTGGGLSEASKLVNVELRKAGMVWKALRFAW
jgi:hypothetical protein